MVKQFLKEEQGQTTVEYLLIIAVIVVVVGVLGKELQKRLPDTVGKVFQGINKNIDGLMAGGVGK